MSSLPSLGEVLQIRPEVLEDQGLLDMVDLSRATESNKKSRGLGAKVPGQDQESDPARFFDLTYPTEDITQTLQTLSRLALEPEAVPGTLLMKGHYGSGKSHVLLAAHHALSSPEVAEEWAGRWGVSSITLPREVLVITRNFIQHTTNNLWDVFFTEVGRADLISKVVNYPDGKMIEEALEGQTTVVLIFDELERWYDALDKKESQQSRNRNFIQALTVVASRDHRLWLLTSVLGEHLEPAETVRRTKPLELSFNSSTDRQKVLQFRLFGRSFEDAGERAEAVVDAYIQSYAKVGIAALDDLRERMIASYPFSPELLDILIKKVPSLGGFQNTRGTLRFLARLVRERHSTRPILSSQDLPIKDSTIMGTLRNLDSSSGGEIVRRAVGDNYDDVGELEHKDELFSAILFYSIADPTHPGITMDELMVAVLDPEENPNVLRDSLRQVKELAYNLHLENNRYLFKTQENPHARINAVARSPQVTDEACQDILIEQLRTRWGLKERTAIYRKDTNETRRALSQIGRARPKFVLSTSALDSRTRLELQNLEERRNLVILIEPRIRRKTNDSAYNLLVDQELTDITRKVEACNRLLEALPEQSSRVIYSDVRRKALSKLDQLLGERFGYFVCWNKTGSALSQVDDSWYELEEFEELDGVSFLQLFKRDFSSFPEIKSRVKALWSDYKHRPFRHVSEHFDATPGEPVPYEDGIVERAARELVKEHEFALQDEQGKTYSAKNIGSLAPAAFLSCTLVDTPDEMGGDDEEDVRLPVHEHVLSSYNPLNKGIKLTWKYPPVRDGMTYRTFVQRYTHTHGWTVGTKMTLDFDATHQSNRFIGSAGDFLDTENIQSGALYFYYVFLVCDTADGTECVLSQRCDVSIPAETSKLGPDMLEINFRAEKNQFLQEVEKQLMSSKNTSADTRVRKLSVEVDNIRHPTLNDWFVSELPLLGGDAESNGSMRLEIRGLYDRHQAMALLQKLPKIEGALYKVTLDLRKPED